MNAIKTFKVSTLIRRLREGAIAFISAPASAKPLAYFRIGLSAVLLAQALAFAGNLLDLYGNRGVVQWSIIDPLGTIGMPKLSWAADALRPWGASDAFAVQLVFLAYVGSLAALLVGWHTRWAAVVAWLTHLAMNTTGAVIIYGVDNFAHIALFYCVWMPVGKSLSMAVSAGRVSGPPSSAARLALRVLQIHLCIIYFTSGWEKASGTQWWDGEAIWRALQVPQFNQFNTTWLPSATWFAKLASWGTLVVELGYPFLVWPRRTRKFGALNTIGMHLGIAVFMGLVSFAAVMIVLTWSAWLVSPEPRAQKAAAAPEPAAAPAAAAA